jgi:hypothetical protein
MPLALELAGSQLNSDDDEEIWKVSYTYEQMTTITVSYTKLINVRCVVVEVQAVHYTLANGHFTVPGAEVRYDDLVNYSLKQLGNDTAYNSMFLDAATVLYGRSAEAAVYTWDAMYGHAALKLKHLQGSSLVQVIDDVLWVQDVIRAIAAKQADIVNEERMTRVWRDDQASSSCDHML